MGWDGTSPTGYARNGHWAPWAKQVERKTSIGEASAVLKTADEWVTPWKRWSITRQSGRGDQGRAGGSRYCRLSAGRDGDAMAREKRSTRTRGRASCGLDKTARDISQLGQIG
jgi:hypothetical protein